MQFGFEAFFCSITGLPSSNVEFDCMGFKQVSIDIGDKIYNNYANTPPSSILMTSLYFINCKSRLVVET